MCRQQKRECRQQTLRLERKRRLCARRVAHEEEEAMRRLFLRKKEETEVRKRTRTMIEKRRTKWRKMNKGKGVEGEVGCRNGCMGGLL